MTFMDFEKFRSFIKESVIFKMLSIGALILVLLIPTAMVTSLIRERSFRKEDAIREITSKWGQSQILGGPILTIPYEIYYKDSKAEVKTRVSYAHFLPEDLYIKGEINPEVRYRGIYKAVLYTSELKIEGKFLAPDFAKFNIKEENVKWEEAFLSLGISDMVGIKEQIKIMWNKDDFIVEPGTKIRNIFESGVNISLPLTSAGEYNFALDLNLNGSQELNFLPFGKKTEVELNSKWQNPNFKGSFLPANREVTENGFKAEWKVLNLNRNYPQQLLEEDSKEIGKSIYKSAFGVNLLLPVDLYQKSNRSIKYAIMFIFLTFLVFFFVEVLNKINIHPIQYLLVGFALIIFYLLLLSLSEYLYFWIAYLIASISTILLITLYAKSIFIKNILAGLMGGILTLLYAFLYILLESQDFSLLVGSIAVFIILATVMYLSRNIDWYTISSNMEGSGK
ncbi:hypothetical protein U472_05480 [Orenia metallireducens]|uniref:Inner membrane protein n=2 Tax=Orenia metallireducens TaxID=1413210 RepID=A0A1C0A9I3_9FIRM|nr:hypothetical protein U472_05480 [Orenia metallireducens]